MNLERDAAGRGKYGLINNRRLSEIVGRLPGGNNPQGLRTDAEMEAVHVFDAVRVLERAGIIEWGEPGTEGEFFVIKLRDIYAQHALAAYAEEVERLGGVYASDIRDLVERSGPSSPFCKKPD